MDTLESLLQRFVDAGDSAAMDTLVARTRPRLLAVARRIGAPQDAEDSVQAAYHSLLRQAARPFDAPVLPWLLTTVVRIAYRRKATNAKQTALAERLGREPAGDDPAEAASDAERATLLRAEVARLPAKYRDPIVLHHFEGLKTAEIAHLLEAPRATVKARLQRGRRLLRGRLHPKLGAALMAVPWWIVDRKVPLTTGGIMTAKKLGAAAAVVALLAVGYVAKRAFEDPEATATDRETALARGGVQEPERPPAETWRAEPAPPSRPEVATAPADLATLRVRIVDDRKRGLPFASVVLRGADQALVVHPKRDGRASFEKLARHVNWELAVRYLGYSSYQESVDLDSTEELVVTLQRPPERVLSVQVVDHAGEPLPGYWVYAYHDAGSVNGITNDEGTVAVKVRGDIWRVQAAPPNSPPETEQRELGDTRTEVRLVVPRMAAIRGRVLRPDGKPYEAAMLRVERDGRLVTKTTAGLVEGKFTIYQPLDAAPVDIAFVGAQVEVKGMIQFQEHLPHAGRLTGVSANSTDHVLRTKEVKLVRALKVQVQTTDRAPVASARIEAMIDTAWLGRREGKTDDEGVLQLRGLAARGFNIEVEPPEGSGLLRRNVFARPQGDSLSVTLWRGVPYSGRVRFRGVALHGAWVNFEVDGEYQPRPVIADDRGRFLLHVPADNPRPITLRISWNGGRGIRMWTHPLRDRAATDIELDSR